MLWDLLLHWIFRLRRMPLIVRDADGSSDAFVTLLDATGTTILYSTYLGEVLRGMILAPAGEKRDSL